MLKKGKGIINTQPAFASFWYRRITEVALLTSAIVSFSWLIATTLPGILALRALTVSMPTAVLGFVLLAVSIAALLINAPRFSRQLTIVVITLLSVVMLLSIIDTGNLNSAYLPLWGVVAFFSAVAGAWSFIPVLVGAVIFSLYLYLANLLALSGVMHFALAIILPLLIGLFIWTRRHQAQERSNQAVTELASELNLESSKTSIILDAIADGVLLIDKEGIVQLINPAAERIIGWGGDDATHLDYRSVLKIVNSKDEIIDRALDPVAQCLTTNESVITDNFGIRTISGKRLLASIMASPLSEGGTGAIVVFRDITAQRAEEREQAEFISTASHEMRTPVAAIEGYLGLALNPQTSTIDEKARMYLTKAHEAAGNLGRLFQDLLDISKAEDGRLNSKPIVVDIPSFVRTLLEDFTRLANEKSLLLRYGAEATAAPTVTPIFYATVDTGHLQEVLSNLVSNAIKYTKEGAVTVDVKGDDSHVFISVEDTGLGIPAEDIPHLFQKFYRVDNSDTREIGGTGLGLYLARKLTESMRGRLTLESTYGKGSKFTIELPRVSKEDALKALQAQAASPTPATPETKL